PADAAAVLGWMTANSLAADAILWGKSFPASTRAAAPVGPALAEAYFSTKDWPGLSDLVKDGNWGALEYVRCTYFARALKELGDENGFRAQWNAASTAALKRHDVVPQLLETVAAWGWEDEAREMLWTVASGTTDPKFALA